MWGVGEATHIYPEQPSVNEYGVDTFLLNGPMFKG